MLNTYLSLQQEDLINIIILCAKQYLYRMKCYKEKPNIMEFTKNVYELYLLEKAVQDLEQNNRIMQKWKKYMENIVV